MQKINKLQQTHNFTVVETKEFPSWTAFISWKEEEESNTYSCFVKPKGETEGCNENTGKNLHYNTYIYSNSLLQEQTVQLLLFVAEMAKRRTTVVKVRQERRENMLRLGRLNHTV